MEIALLAANLVAGTACAIPISRLLRKSCAGATSRFRYFAILLAVYFLESTAVAFGMGIPVFSLALACVWGVAFGLWLRSRMSRRDALKTAFLLALYSSQPAASFILVPVGAWVDGRHVLSAQEGLHFGIPDFPYVPWPLETILGFYAALMASAVVFKTAITTGEVAYLIRRGGKPAATGWQSG